MTRTIIKGRVKRCSRKDYPDHKFVVYDQAVGRTRPGVYERAVTVVGKIAFVWPGEGKSQAGVLPALNVFDTREDANAFFTKGGAVRWIAHRNDHGVPEIFQARIRSFARAQEAGPPLMPARRTQFVRFKAEFVVKFEHVGSGKLGSPTVEGLEPGRR